METAFGEITDVFIGAALTTDFEPLLSGPVNLSHRQTLRLQSERHQNEGVIRTLMREQDSTDIADVELKKTQTRYKHVSERQIAFESMLNHAAGPYEAETGSPWLSRAGSVTDDTITVLSSRVAITYVPNARKTPIELAPKVPVSSSQEGRISRMPSTFTLRSSVPVIASGRSSLSRAATPGGLDRNAAIQARECNIAQIVCKPDFATYGRSAPVRRNDERLDLIRWAVIVFSGNSPIENLA